MLEFNEEYGDLPLFYYNIDVTSIGQIKECLGRIESEVGQPIDILINSVGIFNKGIFNLLNCEMLKLC